MLATFTWQRDLNTVMTCVTMGMCAVITQMTCVTVGMCAVITQMSQTQRARDKTQKSHCPRVTEGSMIKHDLNSSANFVRTKWTVLNTSVSNFSSEREMSSFSQHVQKMP